MSQRYACWIMAGPRYLSPFHQYDGHEVEQHAQRMHFFLLILLKFIFKLILNLIKTVQLLAILLGLVELLALD